MRTKLYNFAGKEDSDLLLSASPKHKRVEENRKINQINSVI